MHFHLIMHGCQIRSILVTHHFPAKSNFMTSSLSLLHFTLTDTARMWPPVFGDPKNHENSIMAKYSFMQIRTLQETANGARNTPPPRPPTRDTATATTAALPSPALPMPARQISGDGKCPGETRVSLVSAYAHTRRPRRRCRRRLGRRRARAHDRRIGYQLKLKSRLEKG